MLAKCCREERGLPRERKFGMTTDYRRSAPSEAGDKMWRTN